MTVLFNFVSILGCVTSYDVHPVISVWLSSMTMNGNKIAIIYSLETIYQTLKSLKASLQEKEVWFVKYNV